MICPKCGSEITEDTDFCGICGAKLADFTDPDHEGEKGLSARTKKRERRRMEKHKFFSKLKLIGGISAVIAVVVVAIVIIGSLKRSEGERIFENVPLGRTVEIADKDTGVVFEVSSDYTILSDVSPYSFVCESDSSVSVEGITLPEWAVLLTKNAQNNISRVSYYEFAALKSSWKGHSADEKIDMTTIQYGKKISEIEKLLGMRAYAKIAMLDNNTTECIFRYNAPDESGNSRVYNLSVYIDDSDDTVKNVSETEMDYIGFFLTVG
jgi:hypothetical protein